MTVGVTGHQGLGTHETIGWIAEVMTEMVDRGEITEGLTCLAVGADQLYAAVLQTRGVPFVAVIPCAQVELSFETDDGLAEFRRLLAAAASSVTLPFDAPSEEAYFA